MIWSLNDRHCLSHKQYFNSGSIGVQRVSASERWDWTTHRSVTTQRVRWSVRHRVSLSVCLSRRNALPSYDEPRRRTVQACKMDCQWNDAVKDDGISKWRRHRVKTIRYVIAHVNRYVRPTDSTAWWRHQYVRQCAQNNDIVTWNAFYSPFMIFVYDTWSAAAAATAFQPRDAMLT